jgi:hypothetical protein
MVGFRLWVASIVPVSSPLPVFSDRLGLPASGVLLLFGGRNPLDDVCAA